MENTFETANTSMNQVIVNSSTNNDHRRIIFLALSALVVVAIVLLAVGISINSQKLSKEISPDMIGVAPSIAISPTSSVEEIQVSPTAVVQDNLLANWKTFSNAFIKMSFPPDVVLTERDASEVLLQKWGPTQKANTEFYDGISLTIQPLELSLTAEDYAKMKIGEIERSGVGQISESLVPIKIGNYSGYTFSVTGLGEHQMIILKSPGGMIINITNSTNDPGNLGFSQTVDSILATIELK